MPVRIIGMIGVTPPSSDAALHVIEGGLSTGLPGEVCPRPRRRRLRSRAGGLQLVVGGRVSGRATCRRTHTKTLGYLVAHRPGFVAPTLMARKIATFDHLTNGRLAVHIITGKTDDEQHGDGDFSPKVRALQARRGISRIDEAHLAERAAVRFLRRVLPGQGRASDVRPLQQPHPLLFFGGASDGALEMGARLCDVYAIYAEPLASTRERIASFRTQAAAFGRLPGFNVSLRPIIAADAKARPGTRPTGFWRR